LHFYFVSAYRHYLEMVWDAGALNIVSEPHQLSGQNLGDIIPVKTSQTLLG